MKEFFPMVEIERKTRETEVRLQLKLKGNGNTDIDTGIGFFNHMLELFAYHGFLDLALNVKGDLYVDEHHTVEDVGIVLGQAISKAIGERKGIRRYGDVTLPMDETLVQVVLDLGGRAYYQDNLQYSREMVGDLPVELIEEFFRSLCNNAGMNLHILMHRGGNNHHLLEACFKAFGRALDQALTYEERLGNKPFLQRAAFNTEGKGELYNYKYTARCFMMEIIPAIDLKDGRCVRLVQGIMNRRLSIARNRCKWPDTGRIKGPGGYTWWIWMGPRMGNLLTWRLSGR